MQPAPLQSPRVPILIAGSGEKHTLRQVAQYADAGNLAPSASMGPMSVNTPEDVQRKLSVLEQHCRDFDRPVSSVLIAHSAPVIIAESRERVEEKLNALPERFRATGIIGTPEDVTQARIWLTWVSRILSSRYAGTISRRSNCWGHASCQTWFPKARFRARSSPDNDHS